MKTDSLPHMTLLVKGCREGVMLTLCDMYDICISSVTCVGVHNIQYMSIKSHRME